MTNSLLAWLWIAAGYLILLGAAVLCVRCSGPIGQEIKQPRARRRALVLRFAEFIGAATLIYAAAILLTGSRVPLGVPLPGVPQLVTTRGVSFAQSSAIRHRMPVDQLGYLAPQPDGWPPLTFDYHSEYVDFTIWHPLGAETRGLGEQEALKTGVLAIVGFKLDYPLTRITYSAPMHKPDERLTVYVSRLRWELEQKGAQFYKTVDPLLLPDYRFEHFELQMKDDEGKLASHFMFFGPYGNRALTVDFATTPEQHELCRPLVMKIMRSFTPGKLVQDMMKREWPDYVAPSPAK